MKFEETPKFWYPRISCNVWFDFSPRTVELQSSECQEISLYVSLSLSVFLSLLFFFLFPSIIHRTPFICLPPTHFLISPFSLISLFLRFLLSFPSFSLFSSFLIPFDFPSTKLIKVGETSPHFPHMPHVISMFFLIFFIFFYCFIRSCKL